MGDRFDEFADWLIEEVSEDRAARAALRQGIGQPIGYAPQVLIQMAPHVQGLNHRQEQTAYAIAPLFALHPANTDQGNLGEHLARLRDGNEDALERRFAALLASHDEELSVHLRRAVMMLRQKEISINWRQLLKDSFAWGYEDGQARVRKKWADSFYRTVQGEADAEPSAASVEKTE